MNIVNVLNSALSLVVTINVIVPSESIGSQAVIDSYSVNVTSVTSLMSPSLQLTVTSVPFDITLNYDTYTIDVSALNCIGSSPTETALLEYGNVVKQIIV